MTRFLKTPKNAETPPQEVEGTEQSCSC